MIVKNAKKKNKFYNQEYEINLCEESTITTVDRTAPERFGEARMYSTLIISDI